MNLLLDTRVLIWWLADDPRLGIVCRERIGDRATRVFVSAASAWEIVIKYKIGRLSLPGPPEDWFEGEQARNGFEGLPPASRTPLRQAHCQSIIATRLTEC